MVRLDGVGLEYGTATVLHGLTFGIREGGFRWLLGPSGAGKTSLLRLLHLAVRPSAGRLELMGQDIGAARRARLPLLRRRIGMVFQDFRLLPHLSAFDNVALPLRLAGRPEGQVRVDTLELLGWVGLSRKLLSRPAELSGGEQQRVAIARAVAVNPPLILMDEPLSNLDAKLRLEMRHEIRRIHHQVRRSTIYVTHDQEEALALADRIVVMQDGTVQQIGTPQELYASPLNLNVARFMGYRNILHFDAAVPAQGGLVRLHRGGASILATLQSGVGAGPVTVAIRPNDIGAGDGPNGIEGRVTEAEYCGADYLVDVETAFGLLHATVHQPVRIGETLRLVLPPGRVLAYAGAAVAQPAALAAE